MRVAYLRDRHWTWRRCVDRWTSADRESTRVATR